MEFYLLSSGSPVDHLVTAATGSIMAAVRTKPFPGTPVPMRGVLVPALVPHLSLLSRTFFSVKRLHGGPELVEANLPSDDAGEKGNHLEFSHLERFLAFGMRLKGRKSVPSAASSWSRLGRL